MQSGGGLGIKKRRIGKPFQKGIFLRKNYLQDGCSAYSFSIGTAESHTKVGTTRSRDGEQKERTEWHNVVFFGKLAEIAGEYLSKGSSVYVEGSLKTKKWEDRDGNKKQITKVIGSKLIMLGPRKKKKRKPRI